MRRLLLVQLLCTGATLTQSSHFKPPCRVPRRIQRFPRELSLHLRLIVWWIVPPLLLSEPKQRWIIPLLRLSEPKQRAPHRCGCLQLTFFRLSNGRSASNFQAAIACCPFPTSCKAEADESRAEPIGNHHLRHAGTAKIVNDPPGVDQLQVLRAVAKRQPHVVRSHTRSASKFQAEPEPPIKKPVAKRKTAVKRSKRLAGKRRRKYE
jgi:hypothetical protein